MEFDTHSAHGWELPRGDSHLLGYLAQAPEVEGRRMYQPEHIRRSVGRSRNRRVALDIGGHVGLWSYYLARWFRDVHAFEPSALMAHCFRRNVQASNVTLHRVALGKSEGTVEMDVVVDNTGATHVSNAPGGTIPLKRLDDFRLSEVDFVKIDVEGFERFVVEGAKDTLQRCRPIVIVEQKEFAGRYGTDRYAAAEYLQSLGAVVLEQVVQDLVFGWPDAPARAS